MIKYFCDICGAEITDENKTDIRVKGKKTGNVGGSKNELKVEVMTSLNGTANDGCFCKYCVIDAVNTADDRPRPA